MVKFIEYCNQCSPLNAEVQNDLLLSIKTKTYTKDQYLLCQTLYLGNLKQLAPFGNTSINLYKGIPINSPFSTTTLFPHSFKASKTGTNVLPKSVKL